MLYTLTVHVSPYLFNLKSLNVYGKMCMVAHTYCASNWNLWKFGQHFPSISYILHLTYFNFNQQISPTLQTNIRSIFSSSPMGMGPSSLELPNQLILQTGHRNAEAKTAPWTPNATQRLQMDLLHTHTRFTDIRLEPHINLDSFT